MLSIVGPGATGGILASELERAGYDVTVVARPQTAERIERAGVVVHTPDGTFHTRPQVAEAPVEGSAVIVAVKSYALGAVLPGIATAEPREVLFLQNGVAHAPLARAALPRCERVACGSIRVVAARGDDGEIVQSSPHVLVETPAATAGWELTRALDAAGCGRVADGDENTVLWRKLRFLAVLALATSWKDAPIGPAIESDPAGVEALAAEIAALAAAEGVPSDGRTAFEHLRALPPETPSSLWNDVRGGGPTELAALGTHLVEMAYHHGIPVPTVTRAVDAIGARLFPV